MNIEEKLKEKSYQETYHELSPLNEVIKLSDAIAICKEALKKQRELCADISTTYFSRAYAITNRILNTPEPTWEN